MISLRYLIGLAGVREWRNSSRPSQDGCIQGGEDGEVDLAMHEMTRIWCRSSSDTPYILHVLYCQLISDRESLLQVDDATFNCIRWVQGFSTRLTFEEKGGKQPTRVASSIHPSSLSRTFLSLHRRRRRQQRQRRPTVHTDIDSNDAIKRFRR
jgi:hypothetical protein